MSCHLILKKEDVSLCCCLSGAYGRMESAHLFIAYLMIAPPFMFMSFNVVVANVPLDTCVPCCGQRLVDGLVVASSLSSQETLQ